MPNMPPQQKITILVDPAFWHRFRLACLQHNITSASKEIRRLMEQRLRHWTKDTPPRRPE